MRGGNPSGDTARTLILIGLIFDFLGEIILLILGIYIVIVGFLVFALGVALLVLAILGFVWMALVWAYSYERTRKGDYAGARAPTLVFGVLSLLSLALIPGILFLVAYAKLGDAVGERRELDLVTAGSRPARGPASAGRRNCPHCGFVDPPAHLPCPGCGQVNG